MNNQTPLELMAVIELFLNKRLDYLLFKCEHIFAGENKNLDVLFKTREDYNSAARILEENGFALRFSERFERYKKMYCKLIDGKMYSIHLHREISWHGMIALDKSLVLDRKVMVSPGIIIPSKEDSILIHAAHILFENFKVTEKEKLVFSGLNADNLDRSYINLQLQKNHWKKGFKEVIKAKGKVRKGMILKSWLTKLYFEPYSILYLTLKLSRIVYRKINPKKNGCLIALIGVNGSGKSTLAKELVGQYTPLTNHLGTKTSYYYFGWEPTFILTRMISSLLKKRPTFQELTFKINQRKKFRFKQELIFIYLFWEFYYRYRKDILTKLKKNELIITDRYFYDLYGQYPYARYSLVMPTLLKMFPIPNFVFLLDAPVEIILNRGKTDKNDPTIIEIKRTALPQGYLHQQRKNYFNLPSNIKKMILDTNRNKKQIMLLILEKTWKRLTQTWS